MSRPYRPSNGTEGEGFIGCWCARCDRDHFNEDTMRGGCRILADTLFYDRDDPKYPEEWTYNEAGEPICTAFVARGTAARKAAVTRRRHRDEASHYLPFMLD